MALWIRDENEITKLSSFFPPPPPHTWPLVKSWAGSLVLLSPDCSVRGQAVIILRHQCIRAARKLIRPPPTPAGFLLTAFLRQSPSAPHSLPHTSSKGTVHHPVSFSRLSFFFFKFLDFCVSSGLICWREPRTTTNFFTLAESPE